MNFLNMMTTYRAAERWLGALGQVYWGLSYERDVMFGERSEPKNFSGLINYHWGGAINLQLIIRIIITCVYACHSFDRYDYHNNYNNYNNYKIIFLFI